MPFTQKIVGHHSKQNHTQLHPLRNNPLGDFQSDREFPILTACDLSIKMALTLCEAPTMKEQHNTGKLHALLFSNNVWVL